MWSVCVNHAWDSENLSKTSLVNNVVNASLIQNLGVLGGSGWILADWNKVGSTNFIDTAML